MREAQEIKRYRLALSLGPRLRSGVPPEFEEPCLFRVKGQSVSSESFGQDLQHALGIFSILKAEDEVVAVPDQVRLATQPRSGLLLEPFIDGSICPQISTVEAPKSSVNPLPYSPITNRAVLPLTPMSKWKSFDR